jgi:hypothetical protein
VIPRFFVAFSVAIFGSFRGAATGAAFFLPFAMAARRAFPRARDVERSS